MAPGGGILAATRPTARPDHPFEYALQVLPRGGQHLVREWISAFRKAQKKAYEATPEQNVPRLMAVGYPWVIGREYKGLYSQYRFLNSSRMRPNPFNMEGVMENDLDVVGLAKTLEIVRANHKGSPMWLRNLDAQLFPHVFTFTEVKTRVRKWPENGQ
ncbi:hypothetical protein W97_06801 [Coniosporium apollinis CBS 100218]|uniref:Uncharacterized protein n=1 Tax=Coniosporium apollinis (strain CBS 100218) TaxID=1168221 RepID=R7Z0R0_CONA1|nr:uncharacterized protein W97_06801 [Coniosporium apollinis CBS 100218]EON67658.1 hypothetical protein W97_06801 [Coniosporium apollinis CBS 100218]